MPLSAARSASIAIYTPPGYDRDGAPCDVLLLFDGWAYLEYVPTPTILDNLLAEGRIRPKVAVIVDYPTVEARHDELPCNPRFADLLAQELLPWVGRPTTSPTTRYERWSPVPATVVSPPPTPPSATRNASGTSWRCPALSGGVRAAWRSRTGSPGSSWSGRVSRSASTWRRGCWKTWNMDRRTNSPPTVSCATYCGPRGYPVRYREFNGGHDYLCWRGALADGLVAPLGD